MVRGRPSHVPRTAALLGVAVAAVALAVAGCGSGGSGVKAPVIAAARTFKLDRFQPNAPVAPGTPIDLSFDIQQPSGRPLTQYKTGAGPHTGVHLIIVRDDLSSIVHRHPPIASNGRIADRVTLPAPGPYRVLVDAYPNLPGQQPNFQLFGRLRVKGAYRPQPLPPFRPVVVTHGYRFAMHGTPHVKALTPAFLKVTVTGPSGRPASFQPWYGALAHAIFFRAGTLDYFHTHVCGAGAANCTSAFGGAKVTGHSSTPGTANVGVLLPIAGTWRLFLQCKVDGRVLTAPFTLKAT
jgi:hypothetical protein